MKKATFKIWLLIFVIVLSLLAIFGFPPKIFSSGALITSVEPNSSAFEQGIRVGQIINSVDGVSVENANDYLTITKDKFSSNERIKTTIIADDIEYILFDSLPPQITVSDIPSTNLNLGLDLVGGSRALVKAKDQQLSQSEIADLVATTNNRLNVYGISDVRVVPVSDLSGNNFMLIEVAGATPKDLENLISQQGKFEAKIGDEVVFAGGEKDIASVCRNDATCAGIESCQQTETGYFCSFRFVIYLSEESAQRHADVTSKIGLNSSNPGYLAQPLDLYLDDQLVDSLLISEDLKGRVTTQIQIQGSGEGETQEDAYDSAEESMKNLQTILITGSLPYQLEIVKLDTISPTLGDEFINQILLAGLVSILAVSIVIFVRYRNFKMSLALILTSFSEVIIILGIAAIIDWNLDLLSIAGIIATIGTGIDQQIIILDESKGSRNLSIRQKLKRAFSIILGAYATALVALLPLMWAGAGLLKGFAVTTLIGITAGIIITRPAFTDIVRLIEE